MRRFIGMKPQASRKIVKVIKPSTIIDTAAFPWKINLIKRSPGRPKNQPVLGRSSAAEVEERGPADDGAVRIVSKAEASGQSDQLVN